MKRWEDLPACMKKQEVKKYYNYLQKHMFALWCKRIGDVIMALMLLVFLFPVFICISIAIKIDSKGPVFFRQPRITTYGKTFYIYKFRTMIDGADKKGAQVTVKDDSRVTKLGKILRKYRIDEFPQLFNILIGDMSFVGTRPEVEKYVKVYTDEMKATLLLPAGVTSWASIQYKDEERLLDLGQNIDEIYINKILPEKMKYNLEALEKFSLFSEIKIMVYTVLAVIKR